MKYSTRILNSGSKKTYEALKFKYSDTSYEEYKKTIIAINKLRCQDILESEEGHILPSNLGRIIILKNKPRVKQLYSMTRPGTRIYNLNTFGYVYRIFHKDRILLRYPHLFRFRAHRQNLKVPLKDILDNQIRDYFKQSDYIEI